MFRALLFVFLFSAASAKTILIEECLNYTVYPLQYDITIAPSFRNERFSYDCDMTITVITNVPTKIIELDAIDLDIFSVKVFKDSNDIVDRPRPFTHDGKKLIIYLREPLLPYKDVSTQYNIKITFRKIVKDQSSGVFLVKYRDESKERYMILTRLSPNNAKYFIPCFDNPRFDSKFKFSVHYFGETRHHYNTSLVIAEQFKQEQHPDRYVINYLPSPQIYLHQVGFHLSQFTSIRTASEYTNDTIVIWAPANKIRNCYYMLSFGETILELIRRYSKTNRSLTTGPINIVAVPMRLDGYEVDSWNLLTNDEIRIINYPHLTSVKQMEKMNFELVQQLARIWLSNPGEKTKWREEYFKEGVATYLAYYFLTQYNFGHTAGIKSRPFTYYGLQMKHLSMDNDWHHTTPALLSFDKEMYIKIPAEYKPLVGLKTASILWMIENYVGSERFHAALIKYINNKRGYHTSLREDYITLTDFMENLDSDTVECFVGHNTSRPSVLLHSWLKHPGYPVVHVQVLRNRTPNVVLLKQWRFKFSGHHAESKYLLPITYITQNTTNCLNCYQPSFTIDKHSYTFTENLNGGWIILNKNASGYYRINYDERNWKLIAKTLMEQPHVIDEMNRAQIANDVFALFVSGDLNQDLAMRILDFLDHEDSIIVWEAVASGYEMLKIKNANCGMTKYMYNEWKAFVQRKIRVVYKALLDKITPDFHTRLFRSSIIELACSVDYKRCLEFADHLYKVWMRLGKIDPDFRRACYQVAFKTNEMQALNGNKFNAYDNEDRLLGKAAVENENWFFTNLQVGQPRPENLTMTTPEPSFEFMSTDKGALTGSGIKSASEMSLITLNLLITVFSIFAWS